MYRKLIEARDLPAGTSGFQAARTLGHAPRRSRSGRAQRPSHPQARFGQWPDRSGRSRQPTQILKPKPPRPDGISNHPPHLVRILQRASRVTRTAAIASAMHADNLRGISASAALARPWHTSCPPHRRIHASASPSGRVPRLRDPPLQPHPSKRRHPEERSDEGSLFLQNSCTRKKRRPDFSERLKNLKIKTSPHPTPQKFRYIISF